MKRAWAFPAKERCTPGSSVVSTIVAATEQTFTIGQSADMRPRLPGLPLVALLAWLPLRVAFAQPATPVPLFQPAPLLDLAALTLRPTDLAGLDLTGFGLANQSSLRDPETDAYLQAGGDAVETAERLNIARETGLRARYVSSLLRPVVPLERLPSGLIAADIRINSAVAEYASADDAATAFAIYEGPLDHEGGVDIPGTRTFGDEAEITRSSTTDSETGKPVQRLELAFRLDNLVAEVTIMDFTNVEPELATVEALGEKLLTKVSYHGAVKEPGLKSPWLPRLSPAAPWIEEGQVHDFYTHIYGRDEVEFAQLVMAIREGLPMPLPATPFPSDDPHPRHIYLFSSPVGAGDELDLPHYATWISLYTTHEHAAESLYSLTPTLGPGYTDVRELPDVAEEISNPSRVFVYSFSAPHTPPVRGYVVITQVGNTLVRVLVDSPDGVRRPGAGDRRAPERLLAGRHGVCAAANGGGGRAPDTGGLSAVAAGFKNSQWQRTRGFCMIEEAPCSSVPPLACSRSTPTIVSCSSVATTSTSSGSRPGAESSQVRPSSRPPGGS